MAPFNYRLPTVPHPRSTSTHVDNAAAWSRLWTAIEKLARTAPEVSSDKGDIEQWVQSWKSLMSNLHDLDVKSEAEGLKPVKPRLVLELQIMAANQKCELLQDSLSGYAGGGGMHGPMYTPPEYPMRYPGCASAVPPPGLPSARKPDHAGKGRHVASISSISDLMGHLGHPQTTTTTATTTAEPDWLQRDYPSGGLRRRSSFLHPVERRTPSPSLTPSLFAKRTLPPPPTISRGIPPPLPPPPMMVPSYPSSGANSPVHSPVPSSPVSTAASPPAPRVRIVTPPAGDWVHATYSPDSPYLPYTPPPPVPLPPLIRPPPLSPPLLIRPPPLSPPMSPMPPSEYYMPKSPYSRDPSNMSTRELTLLIERRQRDIERAQLEISRFQWQIARAVGDITGWLGEMRMGGEMRMSGEMRMGGEPRTNRN